MTLKRYLCVMLVLIKLLQCNTKSVLLNNSESVNNDITYDANPDSGVDDILRNIFYKQCLNNENNNLNPLILYFYCQNYFHDVINSDGVKERKRRGLLSGYSYTKPPIDESIEYDTPPPPESDESIEQTFPYPPAIESSKEIEHEDHSIQTFPYPPPVAQEEIIHEKHIEPLQISVDIPKPPADHPPKSSYGVPLSSITHITESEDIEIPKELLNIAEKKIKALEAEKSPSLPTVHSSEVKSSKDSHNDKKTTRAATGDDSNNNPPATSYGIPDASISQFLKQSSNALKRFGNSTRASDAKPYDLIKSSYGVPLSSVKDLPTLPNTEEKKVARSITNDFLHSIISTDDDESKNLPPAASYGFPEPSVVGALKQSSNALKRHANTSREGDAKPYDLIKSSYGVPLSSVRDLPKIEDESTLIPKVNIKTRFSSNDESETHNHESSSGVVDIEKSVSTAYQIKTDGNLVKD